MQHRRLRSIIILTVIAAFAMAMGAQPAQAAPWYYYKPGHPMGPSTAAANNCTGSWAVRGPSGLFFLTAGHCQSRGTTVYGLGSAFGSVLRNDSGAMDASLVQPQAGVDALQDVVNHANGVIGHTVGKLANSQLPGELFVNKMGRKTGWTYGQIDARWFSWVNGERVRCGNYTSDGGDSGGPVFTRDASNRAWAVGMHVGKVQVASGVWWACFITIDDLLARFGAWLPVFSTSGALTYQSASADHKTFTAATVKPLSYLPE